MPKLRRNEEISLNCGGRIIVKKLVYESPFDHTDVKEAQNLAREVLEEAEEEYPDAKVK